MKRHFQDWITSLVAVLPLACFIQLARKACQIHLTSEEISLITATVKQKRPCRFLVFGFGNDSMLWVKMNHHGKTIFLEDIPLWFDQIIKQHPHYNGYLLTEFKTCRKSPPFRAGEKAGLSVLASAELHRFTNKNICSCFWCKMGEQ